MISGPAASVYPGNLLEKQNLGPTPDLLNQNQCGWAQQFAVTNRPPGDSDAGGGEPPLQYQLAWGQRSEPALRPVLCLGL